MHEKWQLGPQGTFSALLVGLLPPTVCDGPSGGSFQQKSTLTLTDMAAMISPAEPEPNSL